MTRLWLRVTHRGLLAVALTCAGTYALAQVRARFYTAVEDAHLSALLEGGDASGGSSGQRARAEARAGRAWGRLELPRLGLSALVAEGVGEETLSVAVGHFPESAFPGESGNVALAGHRDTVFQMLKHIWPQDVVRLTTPDGTFDYRVEWLAIVDPARRDVVASTGESLLTLVTCYPFEYVGKAPLRYVVRARLI
jgi:LPXTG-site transpeptidase (sortase) family protein